jgi:hypothetical protein
MAVSIDLIEDTAETLLWHANNDNVLATIKCERFCVINLLNDSVTFSARQGNKQVSGTCM